MKDDKPQREFFVGWDVGAWNCDKNSHSRDAIVMLDSNNQIVGEPWGWRNIRQQINHATATEEWIRALFRLCKAEYPTSGFHVIMAIDTPLGFSTEFLDLAMNLTSSETPMVESASNQYLFRETERFLFSNDITPLSAIKDMIGSQATKGMHTLSKFSPRTSSCGVWTDGSLLTVIEAYPAACKGSATIRKLRHHPPLGREDTEDALICALVAYLFGTDRSSLASPPEATPAKEGWIWVPNDALSPG